MRKTVTLTLSLLAAAALLTGCGSEKKDAGSAKAGDASASASAGGAAKGSAKDSDVVKGAVHQVVLEVGGTGPSQVMWVGNTNHFDKVQLPWTKTESVQLEDAELTAGHVLSVVPGSIEAPGGKLKAAPCTIKVDGKVVADNQGGASKSKMCEYMLKG
ncbi:hypothetical protein [Streptomyces sp. NPDC048361]|uniref:hypothetical protein n=1 Tax=Streptomyces sp. NPDC048361 TaxID=3154720 RepID=UPI003435ED1E